MKNKTATVLFTIMLILFAGFTAFAEEADTEMDVINSKVRSLSKNALAIVEYRLADPSRAVEPDMLQSPMVTVWEEYWKNDRPLEASAVLVEPDKVVTNQLVIPPEMIKSIKVSFGDGEEFEAKVEKYMLSMPAWVLLLNGKRKGETVDFKSGFELSFGTKLFYARMDKFRDEFVHRYGSMRVMSEFPDDLFALDMMYGALLFDEEGTAVGMNLCGPVWSEKGSNNWVIGDHLGGKMLSVLEFKAYLESLRGLVGKDILPIRFEIRGKAAGQTDPRLYGICIDGNGTIVVPSPWKTAQIKSVKKIMVSVDGKEQEASFVGQLKHFSAFVVRLPSLQKPASIISKDAKVSLYDVMFSMSAFSVENKDYSLSGPVWFNSYGKGFDEVYYPVARRERNFRGGPFTGASSIDDGEFVFDDEGNCVGIYLSYVEDWKTKAEGRNYWYSDSNLTTKSMARLVGFDELVSVASAPAGNVVADVKPMSLLESRKTVWLGVEMQRITRDLAEYFGVLEETKYGEVGARVIWVYKDSPASKAGIRVGDIVTYVQRKGTRHKISVDNDMLGYSFWRRYPWPNRRYPLIAQLSKFGPETDVVVTFLRDGARKETGLKLETAPADFAAAPFYKCWELGLRVKDVTYEVRRFFQLDDEMSGVMVYAVESGSKAAIAESYTFDIIVKVNGRSVGTVAEFEKVVNEELDSGEGETINFEVLRYGETRFIEMKKPSKEEIEKIREEHRFDDGSKA
ncbi:MAG: PDZ domain-containing protein [Planctomycetota bacterium]|nr:PDZ domain-containing protein [Planctomycetota bacterium]